MSQATVSLVLSGAAPRLRLSADTVKRVQEAALALAYTPNHAARSLRQRRTKIISFVLSTLENPYFGEVVGGAQQAAQARGYAINVIVARSEEATLSALMRHRGGVADGVVMTGRTPRIVAELEDLAAHGVATAVLKHHATALTIPSVSVDLDAGGFMAANHLIGLGHRRIAHIADRAPFSDHAGDRSHGFLRALAAAGIGFEPTWLSEADNSLAGGHEAMRALFAQGDRRPTAVFAFNDLMAVGALHAIREAGLSVPRDIAVVGFDGIQLGAYTQPMLTTVDHPRHELGRLAVEMVLDRLEGREPEVAGHVLPVRLIIRESCGARGSTFTKA
ncbi:MAG: LacI family DNA-binding transcriptional regulator [Proteobacteria bacterium]|nr:LacI family DNA-binding transcriptional regulator [Pseudomonadota bacterium]